MPSIKAAFLSLLLAVLASFIVAVFVKKTKHSLDAQNYAKLNSNCEPIKIHSGKNDIVKCFLDFSSISEIPAKHQAADNFYAQMARLVGEKFPNEFPLRVNYRIFLPEETLDSNSVEIAGKYIHIARGQNSVWRDIKNGCKFPGPCPVMPHKGSTVNAILPGKILKIEQNPLFSVTIYHGENIYSKTSNLQILHDYVQVGSTVSPDSALGQLKNNASVFVEITRNGKNETLEKFFKECWE
jgi:hypothetical protein